MSGVLPQSFFHRPVLEVAPSLLGKILVRKTRNGLLAATITEVEAYDGPEDRACHASRGLTKRTKPLFGPPGHWYVYFVYGMHWMLNIVTCEEGYPAAVLIRGVEGVSGPGRVTKHFGIDEGLNTKKATRAAGLWIEDRDIVVPKKTITCTPRIGVSYAGPWAKKPYRFVIERSSRQKK